MISPEVRDLCLDDCMTGVPVTAGIIAKPDVECTELTDTHKFVIIMSDGIWENVSSTKLCTVTLLPAAADRALRQ